MSSIFPVVSKQQFVVHTYDIDAAGHVNNTVYVRWLEQLRNKIVEQVFGFKNLLAQKYYFVVAAGDLRYRKQITLFEEPQGEMVLESYAHGVFTLRAVFMVNGQKAFTALQKCVLMNTEHGGMFKGKLADFPLTGTKFLTEQEQL